MHDTWRIPPLARLARGRRRRPAAGRPADAWRRRAAPPPRAAAPAPAHGRAPAHGSPPAAVWGQAARAGRRTDARGGFFVADGAGARAHGPAAAAAGGDAGVLTAPRLALVFFCGRPTGRRCPERRPRRGARRGRRAAPGRARGPAHRAARRPRAPCRPTGRAPPCRRGAWQVARRCRWRGGGGQRGRPRRRGARRPAGGRWAWATGVQPSRVCAGTSFDGGRLLDGGALGGLVDAHALTRNADNMDNVQDEAGHLCWS